MRISDVRTYLVGNPWKNWTFVKLLTDEGLHGWGEATAHRAARTAEANVLEMKRYYLGRDPFNTEAIRLISKVTQRKYDLASMEFAATRKDMMAAARDTWNRRDYAVGEEPERPPAGGPMPPDRDDDRVRILGKMKAIKVPEIDFRQANIHDVIAFLQEASREFGYTVVGGGDETEILTDDSTDDDFEVSDEE